MSLSAGVFAMTDQILGVIDGDIIRLDNDPPLPEGCRVGLTIQPPDSSMRRRANVGETTGSAFHVPDEALTPLSDDDQREWRL
jgi:hypothetical protein